MWSTVMCVAWFENWICLKSFLVGSLDGILLYTTSFNHRWPMVNGQPNGAERVLFFCNWFCYAFGSAFTHVLSPNPPPKRQEKSFHYAWAGQDPFSDVNFVKAFLKIPSSHHWFPFLTKTPVSLGCRWYYLLLHRPPTPPAAVVFLLWLWGAKVRTRRERSTMCVPSIICLPRSWVTWFNKPMSQLSSTEWLPVVWWIVSRERIRTVGLGCVKIF